MADMIYNFVLPEVNKHNMREKIREQQQSYMQNAYMLLYEKILELPPDEPSEVTDEAIHVAEDTVKINNLFIWRLFSCKNIHFFRSKILRLKK